jgi:hypothetical protein
MSLPKSQSVRWPPPRRRDRADLAIHHRQARRRLVFGRLRRLPGQEGREASARGTPGAVVRTEWRRRTSGSAAPSNWMRRSSPTPHLVIHHDEDAVVYLNGERIAGSRDTSGLLHRTARSGSPPSASPGAQHLAVSLSPDQRRAVHRRGAGRRRAPRRRGPCRWRVLDQIEASAGGDALAGLRARFDRLGSGGAASGGIGPSCIWTPPRCAARSVCCPHREMLRRVVFAKHFNMGGSHYAYTEGQSDAQHERHFYPGSALCLMELDGPFATIRTLIDDPDGVIRNPDVSYDGSRILFAWKKSDREDDYHLVRNGRGDRPGPPAHVRIGLSPTTKASTCPTATSCSTRPAACRRWTAGGPR